MLGVRSLLQGSIHINMKALVIYFLSAGDLFLFFLFAGAATAVAWQVVLYFILSVAH